MDSVFVKNLRAAGTWVGTQVGIVALYLLLDEFFSTEPGIIFGVVVAPLVLLGLAASLGLIAYVFKK